MGFKYKDIFRIRRSTFSNSGRHIRCFSSMANKRKPGASKNPQLADAQYKEFSFTKSSKKIKTLPCEKLEPKLLLNSLLMLNSII